MARWDCFFLVLTGCFHPPLEHSKPSSAAVFLCSLTYQWQLWRPHPELSLCRSTELISELQSPRGGSRARLLEVTTSWATLGDTCCWISWPWPSLGCSWCSANPFSPALALVGWHRQMWDQHAAWEPCGCNLLALCPSLEAGQGAQGFTCKSWTNSAGPALFLTPGPMWGLFHPDFNNLVLFVTSSPG